MRGFRVFLPSYLDSRTRTANSRWTYLGSTPPTGPRPRRAQRPATGGAPWNVSVDEPGTASAGLRPDSDNNYEATRDVL